VAEGAVGNAPVRCGSTCIDPTAGIVGTEGVVYYCTGCSRYEVQTEKFRRVDGERLEDAPNVPSYETGGAGGQARGR